MYGGRMRLVDRRRYSSSTSLGALALARKGKILVNERTKRSTQTQP
jgi:hypothetical protein